MLEIQFGNHFFKKPTLIFLGMSLETHILVFFLGLTFAGHQETSSGFLY